MSTRLQTNEGPETSPSSGPGDEPTSQTVYIRVVVDVPGVLRDRPAPDKDDETPISVSDSALLIVTAMPGGADQAAGELIIDAAAGDTLRFFAKSGSNNFESAVLIDDIQLVADDAVLEDMALVNLSQETIAPASEAGKPAPTPVDREFSFWQCTVAGEGIQNFSLLLALYGRDEEGQPRFAGVYRWDLTLTVSSAELPPDPNPPNEERTP